MYNAQRSSHGTGVPGTTGTWYVAGFTLLGPPPLAPLSLRPSWPLRTPKEPLLDLTNSAVAAAAVAAGVFVATSTTYPTNTPPLCLPTATTHNFWTKGRGIDGSMQRGDRNGMRKQHLW